MKETKKNRKTSLWVRAASAAFAGTVFMTGSLSVYAATLKSADGYEYLYHLTDFGVKEENDPWMNDHVEYTESGNAEGIVVRTGEVNALTRSITSFEWAVEGGELVETDPFSCVKGNTISVNIGISPKNVTVKVGIILPNGDKKYIEASGADTNHKFSVPSSGDYKIFVENGSKVSVDVDGTYRVY